MSLPMRWEALEPYETKSAPVETAPLLTIEKSVRKTRLSVRRRLRAVGGVIAFTALCSLALVGAGTVVNALRPATELRLAPTSGTAAKATLASASAARKLGFVTVSGTVLSHNSKALARVEAIVELLDAQNKTLQVDSGMVAFDPLPSGQAAPFRVEITDAPEAVAYRVSFRQLDGFCLN
jgi:hypothetical protein